MNDSKKKLLTNKKLLVGFDRLYFDYAIALNIVLNVWLGRIALETNSSFGM
jgi:hypothetical protein